MKKIAIIGSASFLAGKLIKRLSSEDVEVVLWNRNPSKNEFLFDYPSKPPDVQKLTDFDFIFYLAGAGVQSHQKPIYQVLYGVNTLMPIQLITQLHDINYKGTFISFGSYFELGKTTGFSAANEEEIIRSNAPAFNEYCKSKHVLSHFIQGQMNDEQSFSLVHFIIPNMYGKGENKNRLLPYLIKSIREKQPVKLSNGTQVRQFLHVDDIANFICQLVLDSKIEGGIYNLGSTDILSVAELVKRVLIVAEQLGYDLPEIEFGKANRNDVQAGFLALNDQKAKEKFGWNPEKQLERSIKDYFE